MLETKEKTNISDFDLERFDIDFQGFIKEIPGPVSATSPDAEDKKLQLSAFLDNTIDNLSLTYPKIDALTPDIVEKHRNNAQSLLERVSLLGQPQRQVYESFIEQNILQADLVWSIREYKDAATDAEKSEARKNFMQINIELYGEPDRQTYHSLLSEKVAHISGKDRSPDAEAIFKELSDLLPAEAFDEGLSTARFRPSKETVAWMRNVINTLFEGRLVVSRRLLTSSLLVS